MGGGQHRVLRRCSGWRTSRRVNRTRRGVRSRAHSASSPDVGCRPRAHCADDGPHRIHRPGRRGAPAALATDPRVPRANFLLGQDAIFHNDVDAAVAYFEKELAINPSDAMTLYRLGRSVGPQVRLGPGHSGAAAVALDQPVLQRPVHRPRARLPRAGPSSRLPKACCGARSSTTRTTRPPATCSVRCSSVSGARRTHASSSTSPRSSVRSRTDRRSCIVAFVRGRCCARTGRRLVLAGDARRRRRVALASCSPRCTAARHASASSSRPTAPASPGSTRTATAGSTRSS